MNRVNIVLILSIATVGAPALGTRILEPWMSARASSPSGPPPIADEPPKFKPLFDGKTLNGWKQIAGDPAKWTVENGSIVMLGEGGGWIGTDREYSDFELDLEFKLTPGSNSGVYLRAPADKSHISRTGMEIQLIDEYDPSFKDIKDWQKTGALYHVSAPILGRLKPAGQWNRLQIRLRWSRIVVALNGVNVVEDRLNSHPELEEEHPGLKRRTGLIGLQSHNGRVEFRHIRIREETD